MAIVGRIVNADQGYAITLPASWLRLDFETGLAQFIAAAALADPSIADQCQSSTPEELQACLEREAAEVQDSFNDLADAGGQLAFDLETIDKPFPTLVVVYVEPDATGITPELLLAIGPASLRAQGVVGRIQSGLRDVPAGTAVYFYYAMPPDQVANARARQFHLLAGDTVYTVLVVGHKSDDGLVDDADALIQSFEILP